MQIFLIRDSKSNIVHGSETKKRTGCGINLQRPDNIGKYNISGAVNDALGLMTEVSCDKCQTYFTKRVLKADRKEMNRMLKEEKKRSKTLGDDPNIVSLAEVQEQRMKQEKTKKHTPSSTPVEEPAAPVQEPAVPEVNVPEVAPSAEQEPPMPHFEQYTPPPKKPAAPATTSFGGFALDGDLAQFALPKTAVDPTAAAFAANEGKNPNILAEQKSAEEPAEKDIMAQFALPKEPAVLENADDIMAQFALPGMASAGEAQSAVPEEPAEQPAAPESIDDIMAQFGVTSTMEAPEPEDVPAAEVMDDVMAQFSIPDEQTADEAIPAAEADDIVEQFSVPEVPVVEAEILEEDADTDAFTMHAEVPSDNMNNLDEIADRLFGDNKYTAPQPEQAETALVDEVPDLESLISPVQEFASQMPAMSESKIEDLFVPEVEAAAAEEAMPAAQEPIDVVLTVPEMPAPAEEEPAMNEPEVPELGDIILTVPEMSAPAEAIPAAEAVPVAEEAFAEVLETPTFAEAAPAVEEDPVPEEAFAEVPETPAFAEAAPAVEEIPVPEEKIAEVPETPVPESIPAAAHAAPAAPVMPQAAPAMAQSPYVAQPMMQNMPQNPMGQPMPNMQAVPQFMGYDAQGQPVYAYAQPMMPQFMGYDAQGQPVYAQMPQAFMPQSAAAPAVQPVMPQQPAVQAAPVMPQPAPAIPEPAPTPAPAPAQQQNIAAPVAPQPLNAEDFDAPIVEPISKLPKKTQGVHVSKIQQAEMPSAIRSAVQKSAVPQGNIFDQQNADVAALDSIEDILSLMGEDTSQFKKKNEPEVNLQFKEYKPKAKKETSKPVPAPAPAATQSADASSRILSKEELKRQKREEKINAKFKKDLAKRGF